MPVNKIVRDLGLLFALISLLIACNQNETGKTSEAKIFRKVPSSESGISFMNLVDENYHKNYFDSFAYVYNGAGVAVGDINNDSLPDIYFTGNEVPNKLYLNLGNLKFKDITTEAGVDGAEGWDNGVTMVDINNDGLMDIYVCKGGYRDTDASRKNLLYVNQGNLKFKEMAASYGIADSGYSQQALFFDMDNDNDLDLYIAARPDSFYLGLSQMVKGKRNPPDHSRNKLYRNDQDRYTEIGKQAGIGNTYGYALSVTNADLNNDGYEDIFISNDYADNDYMFINQGDGTFKDQIKTATNHNSLFSMGADIADINNDGREDIMVMEMLPENYKRSKVSMPRMDVEGFWAIVDSGFQRQYMHNVLHLNQGNLFFSDIAQLAGVSKTEWSWSTLLADFDNDGQRDIFVANGYRRDLFDGDILEKQNAYVKANVHKYTSADDMFERGFKEYIEIYDPIKVRNYLFKNTGDLHFENVSESWGFEDSTFSNGAAIADFDNDGDIDLVINNLEMEAHLYENTSNGKQRFLQLKLDGPKGNPDGIGAKISLYYDGKMQQYFEQKTVRGYLSSNDPGIHFGLGQIKKVDSIVVRWLDGKENRILGTETNQKLNISYANAVIPVTSPALAQPLFVAENGLLSAPFVHSENEYDEYKDQILLPHMFSRSGPFIALGDVTGDGKEDVFVGGAAGQAGRLYIQQGDKLLAQQLAVFTEDAAYEDEGVLFADMDADGDLDLYVVSGGSAFPEGAEQYQDRLYINNGKGQFTKKQLLPTASSGSCVSASDFDGDGDLDIFRGGRVVPHRYPYAPRSYLLVNENGKLVDRTKELAPTLVEPGMVHTASWADLDGDKKAELIVSGEWMPIRIFSYMGGKMEERTSQFQLTGTEGWWNKIIAADIDQDGDLDLIAGNLGENYKFKASEKKPFEVYAKDFDNNGTNDIFLAKYNGTTQVPIRGRECTSQQCPFIAEKFPTFLSFAESDLKTILGDQIESALHYKAHQFSSMLFINEGGKFTQQRLPVEAQFSTVNGIIVHDFDADGYTDILLSGNKFDVEVETTPADASPGLFLKGTGKLQFQPLGIEESGFFVPYNVKDMQLLKRGSGYTVMVSSNNDSLRSFKLVR
ncbi:VCBS repeat-containing protein [Flavihumibacter cheonanensis]|uniref:VCBS repeat-containing protein n=1 Tax=Flavihumibacter cheonanensis TaxID=1442385 RepID=UPI001EF7F533|nr:VCBS repeat-containing protein [Flavihumibacter cheonanensis]MCG7754135.1 VCBS repeat-containing protein [Flavihumibacter cheonanensis]